MNIKYTKASRRKLHLVLGGVSLFVVLSFSNLFAVTANTPANKTINPNYTPASDTVTTSFAVAGNGACKSTIETTLTSNAGVLSASWDSTAQVITVTFVWKTIKKTQLHRLLAQAGYDNTNARAKDAVYAALPAACQYTRMPLIINNTAN